MDGQFFVKETKADIGRRYNFGVFCGTVETPHICVCEKNDKPFS